MSEFETYTVKVRVETQEIIRYTSLVAGVMGRRLEGWKLVIPRLPVVVATSEPEARANHAVACAMFGLPNVWPVSEGALTISTGKWIVDPPYTTTVSAGSGQRVRLFTWPTEAEVVEGHKAVARWYGAL